MIIFSKLHYISQILDPFTGSSTTGIAANLTNRRFLGIDQELEFLEISKNRKLEIENQRVKSLYNQKINGFNDKKELELFLVNEEQGDYEIETLLNKNIIF
jgi:site-specific DNA-methyltransferase (adenine-specific)